MLTYKKGGKLMEEMISNSWEKTAESDFHNFINEGLQGVRNGRFIAADEVFDELEKRYSAYE